MKLKTEADATVRMPRPARSFAAAAVVGLAALVASPESILNSGSPIPSAFTI